jgi:hypothetical protein
MSKGPVFLTLENLVGELTASGIPLRQAVLKTITELENRTVRWLDPSSKPWGSEDQILGWIVQLLQGFANNRRPSMINGSIDYVAHLRFFRVEQMSSARAGAGRPEQNDWDDAGQCALELLKSRGDPTDPLNQRDGWRSKTDVAKAVLDYLEKRSEKTGDAPPSLNRVRAKVPEWLKKYRALN